MSDQPTAARCSAMSHHGRCIHSAGHEDVIGHRFPTPATPVPTEPEAADGGLPQYLRYLFGRALHVQWGDLPAEDRLYWERQADAVRRAVQPAPALSDAEREFLSWALDQAANEMQLGSLTPGGTEQTAALASLRKLAGGEQQ